MPTEPYNLGEYPYGRAGTPSCHYKEVVPKTQLSTSGATMDNEVKFSDDARTAVLYEAPAPDDKGRGHVSVWKEGEGDYVRVNAVSGDDGMCWEKFNNTDPNAL